MLVHYDESMNFRIYLGEGLGPSEETVVVERDEGVIHLEFNRHGQLIGLGVHGQVEKVIPAEFLAEFAKPP